MRCKEIVEELDGFALPVPRGTDSRQFGRRTVYKPAVILDRAGGRLACIVVDLSEGGAALRLCETARPPAVFALLIEADDVIVACEIAHQTGSTMGVRFIRSPRRASRLAQPMAQRRRDELRKCIRSE